MPERAEVMGGMSAQTDEDDRPKHPPSITGVEVIWNPFEDIVPRITPEEKQAAAASQRCAPADPSQSTARLLCAPSACVAVFIGPCGGDFVQCIAAMHIIVHEDLELGHWRLAQAASWAADS